MNYYNANERVQNAWDAGKCYGDGIIKEYSKRLTVEIGKGYSKRNLWLMLRYFEQKEKMQTVSAQLSWSHYCELLSINDTNILNYYVSISVSQNLSVRQLRERIKSNEYERIDEDTKLKLINKKQNNVVDFSKNPILIKKSYNYGNISEKLLQKLILEDISSFMKELGNRFSFIGREYKRNK